jgi:hypothetical protein
LVVDVAPLKGDVRTPKFRPLREDGILIGDGR